MPKSGRHPHRPLPLSSLRICLQVMHFNHFDGFHKCFFLDFRVAQFYRFPHRGCVSCSDWGVVEVCSSLRGETVALCVFQQNGPKHSTRRVSWASALTTEVGGQTFSSAAAICIPRLLHRSPQWFSL